MKKVYFLLGLSIITFTVYWFFIRDTRPYYEMPQFKIHADQRMEDRARQYDQVKAIQFLEDGGIYADSFEGVDLDKQHVVPILKSLEQKFEMQFWALILKKDSPDYTKDRANYAFDVIAKLPEDPPKLAALKNAIIQAEDNLPGIITVVIGNKWISIAFMNKEEMGVFDDKK